MFKGWLELVMFKLMIVVYIGFIVSLIVRFVVVSELMNM